MIDPYNNFNATRKTTFFSIIFLYKLIKSTLKLDGHSIDSENKRKYKLQFVNRNLRIRNTLLEDEGVFTCLASNSAGNASLDFTLHVQGISSFLK